MKMRRYGSSSELTIRQWDVNSFFEAPSERLVNVPRMVRRPKDHDDLVVTAFGQSKVRVIDTNTTTGGSVLCIGTTAHLVQLRPSIWMRSSALKRRDASCSESVPRCEHSESISSIKIVLGAKNLACREWGKAH